MLTVADALELEVFKPAQLVAGKSGLYKPISWVHNSGVPDAHNWVNGGELVLTTVINMPHDETQQIEFIRALSGRGIAALGVTVGRYLDAIPNSWREAANQLSLPLIAVPFEVRFIDVARTINEQIVQESVSMVRRALHIHHTLSRLVLDDKGLNDLANVLADLIGQSISIETERFDALASANITEIDEARRYTLEYGHTNPLLIDELEQRGVLSEIRETLNSVQLPQIPEVGLEMERILAPIVVHGEIYGYIWIIADGSPLTDIDRLAIESGATVAALMMLHQEAVQTAEASLKGNLISQLMEANPDRATLLTDRALQFQVDLNQTYVMILLENAVENGHIMRLYRRVNRLLGEQERQTIVSQFAGQVVILIQGTLEQAHDAAEWLAQRLTSDQLRFGISAVHRTPLEIAQAHIECQEVLAINQRFNAETSIVLFTELGYMRTLYHAGAGSLAGNPLVPALRELRQETQADLFNTLEIYLDLGGNGVATAEALHIHRSTLNYRLQRITQITEANLSDPMTRLNLQIALKQLRLFETN